MENVHPSPLAIETARLLYLLLGWLLGLLTLPIASGIRDRYVLVGVKKGLQVELDTIRYRAAHGAFGYARQAGRWDKELLREILPSLSVEARVALPTRLREAVEGFLKMDDALFAAAASAAFPGVDKGLSPKRLSLPYLNSRLEFLPRFSHSAQRELLELREQVEMLNQVVEAILELNRMTFTLGPAGNHAAVNNNLQVQYLAALTRYRTIVNLCESIRL